ncbi:MAG: hypothetical protein U0804_25800 [Gemmataceae bacterium]
MPEIIDHGRIDAELEKAFRELRLEHARLGRAIPVSRGGKVVMLSPAEVFASYGLDEHGNPPATSPRPSV